MQCSVCKVEFKQDFFWNSSELEKIQNLKSSNWKEGFPGGSVVKNPPAMQETWVQSLGQEDPKEKEMATHSSILA